MTMMYTMNNPRYTTYEEELIARAPHWEGNPGARTRPQTYQDDNIIVWNKLALLLREKDCWTYVRHTTRTRDGRTAFIALKSHFLGPNNIDHLATSAEKKLKSTSYTNETRRWNFEKYVKTHVDQHTILTDLTRHGYAGIDPRSKVRYQLDGIKTSNLDHVKTRILSNANLRSDFDACVTLYQDFIKQTDEAEPRKSNISAISRGSPSGGHKYKQSDID